MFESLPQEESRQRGRAGWFGDGVIDRIRALPLVSRDLSAFSQTPHQIAPFLVGQILDQALEQCCVD
ncbi:hypothetical protein [uncultured Paracoccus sp.]|uniref:hypothetical protein n=1 Tax=uncultured Paracoccus sp. TaxID=189685 RepID=UPI002615E26F|nr:hypothetical protein [uncultured Paracoccus sp.]